MDELALNPDSGLRKVTEAGAIDGRVAAACTIAMKLLGRDEHFADRRRRVRERTLGIVGGEGIELGLDDDTRSALASSAGDHFGRRFRRCRCGAQKRRPANNASTQQAVQWRESSVAPRASARTRMAIMPLCTPPVGRNDRSGTVERSAAAGIVARSAHSRRPEAPALHFEIDVYVNRGDPPRIAVAVRSCRGDSVANRKDRVRGWPTFGSPTPLPARGVGSKAAPRPHAAIDHRPLRPRRPSPSRSGEQDRSTGQRVSRRSPPRSTGCRIMLWADHRYKVLVVLQGTDTSGKDGTIRGVFSRHQRARRSRRLPGRRRRDDEKAHDFLWRIHQQVPASGRDHDLQPQPLRRRARAGRSSGWIDAADQTMPGASPRSMPSSGMLGGKRNAGAQVLPASSRTKSSACACRQRIDDPDQALEVRAR